MNKGHDKLFSIVMERGIFENTLYMIEVIDYDESSYIKGKDITGEEMIIEDMRNCIVIIDFSKTTHDWVNLKNMLLRYEGRGLALEILEKEGAILFKGNIYPKMLQKANETD